MDNSDKVLITLNLLLCMGGAFVCICRMGMMSGRHTKKVVRGQYVSLFMGFLVSGGSYWLFEAPANFAQIMFGAAVVSFLLLGWGVWKDGAPLYTMRGNR